MIQTAAAFLLKDSGFDTLLSNMKEESCTDRIKRRYPVDERNIFQKMSYCCGEFAKVGR